MAQSNARQTLMAIANAQEAWSRSKGIPLLRAGYVASLADNLLLGALSPRAREQFLRGDGAELQGTGRTPPKMHALVSSSALAVNVFDYWTDRERGLLRSALSLPCDIDSLTFEYKCQRYPVRPRSPNLDLLIRLTDGSVIGVESKFTEPFRHTEGSKLAGKYFAMGATLWDAAGMPGAQALAEQLRSRWQHLDVAQLLKHMLGLAHERPEGQLTLLYLWYDPRTQASSKHAEEVEAFRNQVSGGRVTFSAMSYTDL